MQEREKNIAAMKSLVLCTHLLTRHHIAHHSIAHHSYIFHQIS